MSNKEIHWSDHCKHGVLAKRLACDFCGVKETSMPCNECAPTGTLKPCGEGLLTCLACAPLCTEKRVSSIAKLKAEMIAAWKAAKEAQEAVVATRNAEKRRTAFLASAAEEAAARRLHEALFPAVAGFGEWHRNYETNL